MKRFETFREQVRQAAMARSYQLPALPRLLNDVCDAYLSFDENDRAIAGHIISERGLAKEFNAVINEVRS